MLEYFKNNEEYIDVIDSIMIITSKSDERIELRKWSFNIPT